jgi:ABC-type transport system substrate-binding protein
VILLGTLLVNAATSAVGDEPGRGPLPLWQLEPFDRITLANDKQYDIDPVRIPGNLELELVPDTYIGTPGLPALKEIRDERRNVLYRIRLHDDGQEYYVYGRHIKHIEYFEDLLLAETGRLIKELRFDEAYRHLLAVQERDANWPGARQMLARYYRREADDFALRGQWDRAFWAHVAELRALESLRDSSPDPKKAIESTALTDVAARLEQTADQWIGRVGDDYAEGRRIVARLEQVQPQSATARRWREEYARRAAARLAAAAAQEQAGHSDRAWAELDRAVAITPAAVNVRRAVTAFFTKTPVLRVAVESIPTYRRGPSGWSSADWRCSDLLHLPLVRVAPDPAHQGPGWHSDLVSSLEKNETATNLTLELRHGSRWPGDRKAVTVMDVYRLLEQTCRPGQPMYHPAVSRLVVGLKPVFPSRLMIGFDRPQFQPAVWLQFPMLRLSTDATVENGAAGWGAGRHGLGPFTLRSLSSDLATFLANPTYLEPKLPRIGLIVEERMRSNAARLEALADGRVDLIPNLPQRLHAKASAIPHVRIVRLRPPRIHVLQFNQNRPELRSIALRRAIEYAIDRMAVFKKVGVIADDLNRVITAPIPFGSFGYSTSVLPRPFDPLLARALLLGVQKEQKLTGPLTLAHSGIETDAVVCGEIARQLEAVGLKVRLLDLEVESAFNPLDADLRHQVFSVSDPIYDVLTLLTRDNPSLAQFCGGWLNFLISELMAASSETAAKELLLKLHRALHEEVPILPLWQWEEELALGPNVADIVSEPRSAYSGIARWTVTPRFPESNWADK